MYIPRQQTIASLRGVGESLQTLGALKAAEKERENQSLLSGNRFDLQTEQMRGQQEERILGAKSMLAREEEAKVRTLNDIARNERIEKATSERNAIQDSATEERARKEAYKTERVNPRQELTQQWTASGIPIEKQKEHFRKLDSALGAGVLDSAMTREEIGKLFQTSVENMRANAENAGKLKEIDNYQKWSAASNDLNGIDPDSDPKVRVLQDAASKDGWVIYSFKTQTPMVSADGTTITTPEERDAKGHIIPGTGGKPVMKTTWKYTVLPKKVFEGIDQTEEKPVEAAPENLPTMDKFLSGPQLVRPDGSVRVGTQKSTGKPVYKNLKGELWTD